MSGLGPGGRASASTTIPTPAPNGVTRSVSKAGHVVHVYVCRLLSGSPQLQPGGELAEVGWFTPGEIPEPHTNALRYSLADVVAGREGVERVGLRRT